MPSVTSGVVLPKHRIPNKTAYVLGAGFSAPMGMPMLSNFLQESLKLLKARYAAVYQPPNNNKNKSPEDKAYLARLIDKINGYLIAVGVLPNSQKNLEELWSFADIQLSVEQPPNPPGENPLKDLMVETLLAAYERHEDNLKKQRDGDDGENAPTVPRKYFHPMKGVTDGVKNGDSQFNVCLYDAFLSQVIQGLGRKGGVWRQDVVITLNQDLLIERKLEPLKKLQPSSPIPPVCIYHGAVDEHPNAVPSHMQLKLSYDATDRDNTEFISFGECANKATVVFPYLKLHGSANWSSLGDDVQNPQTLQVIDTPEIRQPSPEGGLRWSKIVMTAPTWNKNPFGKMPLSRILRNVATHLRTASKVVIIGYSLPPTDSYIRHLFAYGFSTIDLPEIEIWDIRKKEEMKDKIAHMFGGILADQVKYYDTGLDGFVRAHPVENSIQ